MTWRPWGRNLRRWLDALPRKRRGSAPAMPVVGLALGGGFARGLAHIGVLKVLEENRVPIHAVSGISAGAIMGGAYASGLSPEEMADFARSVRFKDFARWTVSRLGLASNARMDGLLRRCLRATTFEELRIPLAVSAADIRDGSEVIFRSGDLLAPIRASCAYPGLFLPVRIGERTLIDGGFAASMPVRALGEMGATHIIAVHLVCRTFPGVVPRNIVQMVGQCFSLLQSRVGEEWRQAAHCTIEPPVAGHAWDAFDAAPQLIAAGEEAARRMLPTILGWFEPRVAPVLAWSR